MSSEFTSTLAQGACFAQKNASDCGLDPFATVSLYAGDLDMSMRSVRSYFRKVVILHVFELGA